MSAVRKNRQKLKSIKDRYLNTIHRLNSQSVSKKTDAYADIDWDSEEFKLDKKDSRWRTSSRNFFENTSWYKSLPEDVQSEFALEQITNQLKTAILFENTLQRGFLAMLARMENNAPEFRYCHHEVIEESHHSMMFQEFINRTGLDPKLEWFKKVLAKDVINFSRYPAIFFVFVLSGEEPLDFVQRFVLKNKRENIHPLYRRIIEIHLQEETRHICFAKTYLEKHFKELNHLNKIRLCTFSPITYYFVNRYYFLPTKETIKKFDIPKEAIREAFSEDFKEYILNSMEHTTRTFEKIGIINNYNRWLWKKLKLCN